MFAFLAVLSVSIPAKIVLESYSQVFSREITVVTVVGSSIRNLLESPSFDVGV